MSHSNDWFLVIVPFEPEKWLSPLLAADRDLGGTGCPGGRDAVGRHPATLGEQEVFHQPLSRASNPTQCGLRQATQFLLFHFPQLHNSVILILRVPTRVSSLLEDSGS